MKCDFFSRARYTLPNLPLPSGLPMSKSLNDHLRTSGFALLCERQHTKKITQVSARSGNNDAGAA